MSRNSTSKSFQRNSTSDGSRLPSLRASTSSRERRQSGSKRKTEDPAALPLVAHRQSSVSMTPMRGGSVTTPSEPRFPDESTRALPALGSSTPNSKSDSPTYKEPPPPPGRRKSSVSKLRSPAIEGPAPPGSKAAATSAKIERRGTLVKIGLPPPSRTKSKKDKRSELKSKVEPLPEIVLPPPTPPSANHQVDMSLPGEKEKVLKAMAKISGPIVQYLPDGIPKSLLRWRYVLYVALKVLQFKTYDPRTDAAPTFEELNISNRIYDDEVSNAQACRDITDIIGAFRVTRVLSTPPSNREEREIDSLDAILGRFKGFARFPPATRMKLYSVASIVSYPRGTVLIRSGLNATTWYTILLGECAQFAPPSSVEDVSTVRILQKYEVGASIGDFVNTGPREMRGVTISCLMRTILIKIEKADYITVSRDTKSLEAYQLEFLGSVPALSDLSKQMLMQLGARSVVRRYPGGSLILKEHEPNANIYFVVRGACRGLQQLTFLKKPGPKPALFNQTYMLEAFHNQPVDAEKDEIVREFALVADITVGQFFPPLIPSQELKKLRKARKREASSARATPEGPEEGSAPTSAWAILQQSINSINSSPISVMASEVTECIIITRQDFLEVTTPETVRKMTEPKASPLDQPFELIIEKYMVAFGWKESVLMFSKERIPPYVKCKRRRRRNEKPKKAVIVYRDEQEAKERELIVKLTRLTEATPPTDNDGPRLSELLDSQPHPKAVSGQASSGM
ncbi:uncharacterized protein BJ171DRAFT_631575 [Polychytrium aggregatum]|uniref:uncharacterized protein n=1 Tax=Polychytrium aggregatum TaxID=110093 RepID=UPI0022FF226A|nr:uncharacterized protein BJ171DRAFT_631575 [Polychytrium aggregatum]KAI9199463.1 hypothetical protein BJ171DRAFT_631575 [Polychytrium aggregatum]